jgi:hypothetical protein
MSDLVLGLLVLGAVLFTGVLVYNRVQERRAAGAFPPAQSDALLEEAVHRREPSLGKPAPAAPAAPDVRIDERADYVIGLETAASREMVREGWAPIQQRFRRALLAGPEDGHWRAALQLVSRAGAVSEAELIEFRSAVETLGARLGASVAAPEMRAALDAARELDRVCADSDIQVALHVVAANLEPPPGEQPFQVVRREDGVTLMLDVALTPDLGASYETMARTGRSLADAHGGRLVDDRGNPLDERGLAAIGAQLEAVRQALAARGIETGSPLALRLFS